MPASSRKYEVEGGYTGFRSSVGKADVSIFNVPWTTLSGYNKDSIGPPTPEQIHDSYTKAIKLQWRLNKVIGISSETDDGVTSVITEGQISGGYDPNQPVSGSSFDPYLILEPYHRETIYPRTRGVNYPRARASVGVNRLYNGSTDDEANFIGWGVVDMGFSAYVSNIDSTVNSSISLGVHGVGLEIDTDNEKRAHAYVMLTGGFHFVATAYARVSSGIASTSVDPSNLTAQASTTALGYSADTFVRFDSLDFYDTFI